MCNNFYWKSTEGLVPIQSFIFMGDQLMSSSICVSWNRPSFIKQGSFLAISPLTLQPFENQNKYVAENRTKDCVRVEGIRVNITWFFNK